MIDQGPGEREARGISLEDLPAGSVVYVSRGAFRMEAVGYDGAIIDRSGVVQPIRGAVTAPYHAPAPGENTGVDRLPVSATFRAPDLPSLFGSQVDVPLLAAPTGAMELRPRPIRPISPILALSRAALVGLGSVVFACGVVIGAAALRPEPALAERTPAASPAPAPAEAPVAAVATAPVEEAPAMIQLTAPVKISAHKRAAAHRVTAAPPVVEQAGTKPWVDPFAE